MPRVTISMPVYMRPKRTARAIKCIMDQTVDDWEAFIVGDDCPDYFSHKIPLYDHRVRCWNETNHRGGWGYNITNRSIDKSTGKYFMFMGSDDVISSWHMENYLSEIEGTYYDFVYFDYFLLGERHNTKLKRGKIGDNALIIRTEFLRKMPMRKPEYGHDWTLIENMIKAGAKYKKSNNYPTYHIMSTSKHPVDLMGLD